MHKSPAGGICLVLTEGNSFHNIEETASLDRYFLEDGAGVLHFFIWITIPRSAIHI